MTETEQVILKELQQDLPIASRPFYDIAKKAGVSEDELLVKIKGLKERGVIRRLNAVLRHRMVGYQANALCVWKVAENRVDEVGTLFAGFAEVTHCYEREIYPQWQYNLYTMVHAMTRQDCESIIRKMSELSMVKEYQIFYSTRELKKSTMSYF